MRFRLIPVLAVSSFLAFGATIAGNAIAQAKVKINVAYENNPGEPVDKVIHYWANLLKEKSKGEIELVPYPSSQLGSKKDVTEQALMGVNVITITDVGFLQDYDADLGILFGPYLTDDPAKLFRIYEGAWYKAKEAILKKKGIHVVMTNYLYGVRHILAKKPINTPADMKGLKIRAPNQAMLIKTIEAMGATATPLPLGEVYPALTQGLVDGVENPIPVLYGGKFFEQAKYLSLVGHLTNTSMWVGGEMFFQNPLTGTSRAYSRNREGRRRVQPKDRGRERRRIAGQNEGRRRDHHQTGCCALPRSNQDGLQAVSEMDAWPL